MAMLKDPVMGDDPPDDRPACECDVAKARRELIEAWADILHANYLETRSGISYETENKAIENLIDRFIEPVLPCDGDCA